jgi:anaerobic ribonucleoside-triphosphate reductase
MRKVPCIIFSRVVGYFSPIYEWNKGKKEEFAERKEISLSKIKDKLK